MLLLLLIGVGILYLRIPLIYILLLSYSSVKESIAFWFVEWFPLPSSFLDILTPTVGV